MKRFPSSACTSAIQITRPLESIAERILRIVDHLRRRFGRLKRRAHLLDLRCLLFQLRAENRHYLLHLYRLDLNFETG